jgi:hypothetical protein
MTVALIQRGVGGEAIEVFFAVNVPDPHACAAVEDDGERAIVVGAVGVGERDEFGGVAENGRFR